MTKISATELKKLLKEGKAIVGKDRTLKGLKKGSVERIFLSSNCPKAAEQDIERYALMSGAEVIKLSYPNDELGVMCRKQFPISVLSFAKR
ncbi:ribosomal L7Ae/L30e/S12e/Gadd45 family protein [Candidatus Woesearchaeota archaeon]|nr:ribosomal L7Ae/L30e/S12e/Gadd45 family protein [Candidatus Woesearchaeota archaeon]